MQEHRGTGNGTGLGLLELVSSVREISQVLFIFVLFYVTAFEISESH